ncbi:MAG: hypothetical protein C0620_12700 [Desulfuromonas sp.]|nr:MAG: hypothetical protein C0620_12700 [Desulfuromonas sp.]
MINNHDHDATDHDPFQPLYSPESDVELMILVSRLAAEEIPSQTSNDHFGSLYIGPQIAHFNRKTVFVPASEFQRAQHVLTDFLQRQYPVRDAANAFPLTLWQKVRTIAEFLLFGWMVPQPPVTPPPFSFSLQWQATPACFVVTCSGPLTGAGMCDAGNALLSHPQWHKGHHVIFDHRHLDFSATSPNDVAQIRHFHHMHEEQIGNGWSVFVIDEEQSDRWHALWAQGDAITSTNRTFVVSRLDDAFSWLVQHGSGMK